MGRWKSRWKKKINWKISYAEFRNSHFFTNDYVNERTRFDFNNNVIILINDDRCFRAKKDSEGQSLKKKDYNDA